MAIDSISSAGSAYQSSGVSASRPVDSGAAEAGAAQGGEKPNVIGEAIVLMMRQELQRLQDKQKEIMQSIEEEVAS